VAPGLTVAAPEPCKSFYQYRLKNALIQVKFCTGSAPGIGVESRYGPPPSGPSSRPGRQRWERLQSVRPATRRFPPE